MLPEKVILLSSGSLSVGIIAMMMFALQTLLYLKKRERVWYAWSAAISFSAVIYAVGIFIEYNTQAGPLNRFSGILEFAALILLIHCMSGFTFSYLNIRARKYHLYAGIFHGLVMTLLWTTDLIVANEYSSWHFSNLPSPYVEPTIGKLVVIFEAYIAISALSNLIIWFRHRDTNIRHRKAFLLGMGFWIALGIHDGLVSTGLPAFQYMMEYGFLGFAFSLLWVVINSYLEMETDEKYRLITEFANEAIIIVQDEKIVFGNPSFCQLIDVTAISDSSAEIFFEMMPPQDREFYIRIYNSLLKGENPPDRHIMRINRKDEVRYLEIVITSIKYRGRNGALGVMRDITEQKQEAEALRSAEEKLARAKKMESLGLLAGGVAHDLNNVLSIIINYPEVLLLDLSKESELAEPLEAIKSAGERAEAIVQDLLTIARGVAMQKEQLNVNEIIKDYLNSPECERLRQYHKSVTIKAALDPNLPTIDGSFSHIRKIIMNLVSNAAEAIEGSGNVLISTMRCRLDKPMINYANSKPGDYVNITVSDNGPGIPHEDIERIYEPFFTKKVMGRSGTGLGLSVVWNVVQDHKGYIDVSTGGDGTTFKLYFPLGKMDTINSKHLVPVSEYLGNGERILVVDDADAQRNLMCRLLDRLGYKTVPVSSGEKAVEYMKNHTADLLLLDMIMLPGINGRETYEKILSVRPDQKAIIISGFAETNDVKEALKMGAGRYLKKPFSMQEIGLAVKAELQKK